MGFVNCLSKGLVEAAGHDIGVGRKQRKKNGIALQSLIGKEGAFIVLNEISTRCQTLGMIMSVLVFA